MQQATAPAMGTRSAADPIYIRETAAVGWIIDRCDATAPVVEPVAGDWAGGQDHSVAGSSSVARCVAVLRVFDRFDRFASFDPSAVPGVFDPLSSPSEAASFSPSVAM